MTPFGSKKWHQEAWKVYTLVSRTGLTRVVKFGLQELERAYQKEWEQRQWTLSSFRRVEGVGGGLELETGWADYTLGTCRRLRKKDKAEQIQGAIKDLVGGRSKHLKVPKESPPPAGPGDIEGVVSESPAGTGIPSVVVKQGFQIGPQVTGRLVNGTWLCRLRWLTSGWGRVVAGILFRKDLSVQQEIQPTDRGGKVEGGYIEATTRVREAYQRKLRAITTFEKAERELHSSERLGKAEGEGLSPHPLVWPAWWNNVREWDEPWPPCWLELTYRIPPGSPDNGDWALLPICLYTPPPDSTNSDTCGRAVKYIDRIVAETQWGRLAVTIVYQRHLLQQSDYRVWLLSGAFRQYYDSASFLAKEHVKLGEELRNSTDECLIELIRLEQQWEGIAYPPPVD